MVGRERNPVSASTTVNHRGAQLLFTGGRWYQKRGNDLVAIAPPSGVLVEQLPDDYSVRWIAGVPYFHSNGLYFLWRERQHRYEILQTPPAGEPRAGADEPPADSVRQSGATR